MTPGSVWMSPYLLDCLVRPPPPGRAAAELWQTPPRPLRCSCPIYSLSVRRRHRGTRTLAPLPNEVATGAGAVSSFPSGTFHRWLPARDLPGGHRRGQRGPAAPVGTGRSGTGAGFAAGNKGASRWPHRGPSRGQVWLLWARGRGGRATRQGWWQPRVCPRVPSGDSGSLVASAHLAWLGLAVGDRPPAAADEPSAPRYPLGPVSPLGDTGGVPSPPAPGPPPVPCPGASGAMAWGQRGRSPAAGPRPLSQAPDVTVDRGNVTGRPRAPAAERRGDVMALGDVIAHGRVPGERHGAALHRSRTAPTRPGGGMVVMQRRDVTHCSR